ncbi:MAG: hypothetical protein L0Z68_06830 [Gammaproteobacteria bacterium]|nr:hypothetical protein [Gammaproteobacteria bacterium]
MICAPLPYRIIIASLGIVVVAGCFGTLPVESQLEDTPLFRQIDANVGIYFTAEARTAVAVHTLGRIKVGEVSVARFQQVFAAMFTQTKELPDWPPWRHERLTGIDGVMELEQVNTDFTIGNDYGTPDVISLTYHACLYETNGAEVRCWTTSAFRSHQRHAFECLDIESCLLPQFEVVIREAIAKFMVEVDGDPAIKAWAERVSKEHKLK